jgi:hypothetical protein
VSTYKVRRTRPGGANVERRKRQDAAVVSGEAHVRSLVQQNALSQWHSQGSAGYRVAAQKRQNSLLEEDLDQAEKELKTLRRERLRALLAADFAQQKAQLAAMGLSIIEPEF